MNLFELFNNAGAGILLGAVDKISKAIKESGAFRYFSVNDTEMISDYKDFECTIIASAMASIFLNLDLKNSSHKQDIQTVYIGKSADFLRKIISKEYKLPELNLNKSKARLFFKGDMEALICFEIHVKFEKYLKDVIEALQTKSPFYFSEYEVPEVDTLTGEKKFGDERLRDFVWNVLLAEERPDFEDFENVSNYIGSKVYLELTDGENQLLFSFIDDLTKLKVN